MDQSQRERWLREAAKTTQRARDMNRAISRAASQMSAQQLARLEINDRITKRMVEQHAAPLVTRDAVLTLVRETIALKRLTRVLIVLTVAVLAVSIITFVRT